MNDRLPQFRTPIDVDGFGTLDIHFVHSKSSNANAIPLLFLHGWPGSFVEAYKILNPLNEAGFDVVAPSLPGYGFSSYTNKPGFKQDQHAETFHKLMQRLGYEKYVVQGGDWGSVLARAMAILYSDSIQAIHINILLMDKPHLGKEPEYTAIEKKFLERTEWYKTGEIAYAYLHATKPLKLGFGLHDSPVAMLAWMADKLFLWTDDYPWTHDLIITWTLLHYFPGPTTAVAMYHENPVDDIIRDGLAARHYVKVPTGVSLFPKELSLVPRSWAETKVNVASWDVHERGGHFAAWESPTELVSDVDRFFKSVWN